MKLPTFLWINKLFYSRIISLLWIFHLRLALNIDVQINQLCYFHSVTHQFVDPKLFHLLLISRYISSNKNVSTFWSLRSETKRPNSSESPSSRLSHASSSSWLRVDEFGRSPRIRRCHAASDFPESVSVWSEIAFFRQVHGKTLSLKWFYRLCT